MTNRPDPFADETLSARFDGAPPAPADSPPHAPETEAEVFAAYARLRADLRAVDHPTAGDFDTWRAAAIDAAAPAAITPVTELVPRTRRRAAPAWLGAAAAVTLVVAGAIGALSRVDRDNSDTASSVGYAPLTSEAAEAATTPDLAEDQLRSSEGGTDGATMAGGGAGLTAMQGAVQDLGEVADLDALVLAYRSQLTAPPVEAPATDQTFSAEKAAECGPLVAFATLADQAVVVTADRERLVVRDAESCAELGSFQP